jgi:hypothetical protein
LKNYNQIEIAASLLLSELEKEVINGLNPGTNVVLYMDTLKRALADSDSALGSDLRYMAEQCAKAYSTKN